jgi:hypothetical protein
VADVAAYGAAQRAAVWAQVEPTLRLAHEWAAQYPLGSTMDDRAADEVERATFAALRQRDGQ